MKLRSESEIVALIFVRRQIYFTLLFIVDRVSLQNPFILRALPEPPFQEPFRFNGIFQGERSKQTSKQTEPVAMETPGKITGDPAEFRVFLQNQLSFVTMF